MDEPNPFIAEFRRLLDTLPSNSFGAWQYAYRQVIYTMSVEILTRFPEAVIGSAPAGGRGGRPPGPGDPPPRAPHVDGGGSGGLGGRPNAITVLAGLITELSDPKNGKQ